LAYQKLVATVKKDLTGLVTDLEKRLTNLFSPLLAFLPWLKLAQPMLPGTVLTNLRDVATRMYEQLNLFITDPVGYILSGLWNTFVHYLCYALAYALGTVTDTLPPVPKWGKEDKETSSQAG
jgi:hypothetical protein